MKLIDFKEDSALDSTKVLPTNKTEHYKYFAVRKVLEKELFLQTSTNIKFMAKINPVTHPNIVLNISYTEQDGIVKIKNSSYFDDTLALKLNANYKVIN